MCARREESEHLFRSHYILFPLGALQFARDFRLHIGCELACSRLLAAWKTQATLRRMRPNWRGSSYHVPHARIRLLAAARAYPGAAATVRPHRDAASAEAGCLAARRFHAASRGREGLGDPAVRAVRGAAAGIPILPDD